MSLALSDFLETLFLVNRGSGESDIKKKRKEKDTGIPWSHSSSVRLPFLPLKISQPLRCAPSLLLHHA